MAERTYYNKSEVDNLISQTKEKLIKKIEETIVVGEKDASAPKNAQKSLSIKILRSETK